MTDAEIRQVYREERAIKRTAARCHVAQVRVARVVADLVEEVMGKTRPPRYRDDHATFVANRDRQALRRWRCHCGVIASGPTCHHGHRAPWMQ